MIFWIGAAIIIFVCSLVWAFISMRAVTANNEQVSVETAPLPPQPRAKNTPILEQTLAPTQVPVAEQPEQSMQADGVTVTAEKAEAHSPDAMTATEELRLSAVPLATEMTPTPLPSGQATPATIEEARQQLQRAIDRSHAKQAARTSVQQPEDVASAAKPVKIVDGEKKEGAHIMTGEPPFALGQFIGTITIQRRKA